MSEKEKGGRRFFGKLSKSEYYSPAVWTAMKKTPFSTEPYCKGVLGNYNSLTQGSFNKVLSVVVRHCGKTLLDKVKKMNTFDMGSGLGIQVT